MTIKQTLKNTARIGVATLGLAGLLGSGTSCQMTPQEESQFISTMGVLAQTNPNSTPQDRSAGTALYNLGQMQHQLQVAEAGRSQVNVNVGNQGGQLQSQQSKRTWAYEEELYFNLCTNVRDANHDNIIDDSELIGTKGIFNQNERFFLVARYPGRNTDSGPYNFKIYEKNFGVFKMGEKQRKASTCSIPYGNSYYKVMELAPRELKPGKYKVGTSGGWLDFEIIE